MQSIGDALLQMVNVPFGALFLFLFLGMAAGISIGRRLQYKEDNERANPHNQ